MPAWFKQYGFPVMYVEFICVELLVFPPAGLKNVIFHSNPESNLIVVPTRGLIRLGQFVRLCARQRSADWGIADVSRFRIRIWRA